MDKITDALNARSRAFLERVEKEQARSAPASPAEGTARVGGWTKIGTTLEELLEAVFAFLCDREQRDPAREFMSTFPNGNVRKATGGQLLRAIADMTHLRAASAPTVAAICNDAMRRPSHLTNLITIRNGVVHDGVLPPYMQIQSTLQPVAQLLKSYRKQAGW